VCCVSQGVVKALFEHRMLPRVLAGSSVGSIVAGLVATRTDDELRETFRWAGGPDSFQHRDLLVLGAVLLCGSVCYGAVPPPC
jgi:predicted acylesterase/phospholipase RssA